MKLLKKNILQNNSNNNINILLQKVHLLEIKSRYLSTHLFAGAYRSAFKGRGMTFKEVKEYAPGEDVRFIEWNVSARMGHPYSKVFEEERELNVFLLIDVSASNCIGSFQQSKRNFITEIAATLIFSVIANHDKAGVIFFTNKIEKLIPLNKTRTHALYILRELLFFQPKEQQTNIAKAINFLNKISKQRSIVFILSDFADEGYKNSLRIAAKHHDVIGIQVYDKRDAALPNVGLVYLQDAETGKIKCIDTSDAEEQLNYTNQFQTKLMHNTREIFKQATAQLLQIATHEDYVKMLQQFFMKRA